MSTALVKVRADMCLNSGAAPESVVKEKTVRSGSVAAKLSIIWGISLLPYGIEPLALIGFGNGASLVLSSPTSSKLPNTRLG